MLYWLPIDSFAFFFVGEVFFYQAVKLKLSMENMKLKNLVKNIDLKVYTFKRNKKWDL